MSRFYYALFPWIIAEKNIFSSFFSADKIVTPFIKENSHLVILYWAAIGVGILKGAHNYGSPNIFFSVSFLIYIVFLLFVFASIAFHKRQEF